MINLQQRATESEDVRAELGQLQNRVIGLASLHGNIYGSDSDGQIDATRLVSDALTSALGDVDPDLLV